MPGKGCIKRSGRKHTPIVSQKQSGFMGAEYGRRKKGLRPRIESMSEAELARHLHEVKGKSLPKASRTKAARSARRKRGRR